MTPAASRRSFTPSIVLGLLCLMYFLTYIDRVNLATAASAIQKDFHLSKTQFGFVASVFGYPYAVFQVIGGRVGDRLGPRKTLLICGAIWALATVITGFAVGLISLVVFRIALGFGEGATFPTATRAMQSWTPAGRRGFAQGITHSFARLGNAVTPPIVAWLMVWLTWRGAFVVLGAVSMIWVVGWWLYYRDDPRDHPRITAADLDRLPAPGGPKAAARPVPWRRLVLRILPVTLTYFCYGWSLWLFLTWLPSFFLDGYHLDLKKSALYASGVFFAGVVGDALGGVISDYLLHRTGRVTFARLVVIIVGMLGAAGCLIPVLFSRDLAVLTPCLAGGFFFLELVIGPVWSVPMDIAPQYSGTASGLMNTGSAVAAIVSPLAFGIVVDVTGDWHLPFIGSIGLLFVGTALSFTMRPDRKFVDEPEVELPVAQVTSGKLQ
ncbi:MAG TPA: MFS transporter [Kofleriaceae bacterium]